MKLTKGYISKLLSKQHQTRKRMKVHKTLIENHAITYKKYHSLNLRNKTLKNII